MLSLIRSVRRQFREWAHRGHAEPDRFEIDWYAIPYNRIAIVNLLLSNQVEGRYLEIGCFWNALFDAVMARHKTGVDPVRGGTHRMPSDDYFRRHPGERFHVVFIDGLHTYEQVRRDVVNSLKALEPGGWIALHDLHPRTWIEEHVPDISIGRTWTGDVWKVAFELAATPGLDFRLFKIDHGVGVVRKLANDVQLADRQAELGPQRFRYFCDRYGELPIVDHEAGREWILAHLNDRRA